MLHRAAWHNRLAAVQWLRAHGAEWPAAFASDTGTTGVLFKMCWSAAAVQWALSNGASWREWECEDCLAEKYELAQFRQQAAELLERAHVNGCPCTCGHAQQQQQQQQQLRWLQ